MKNLVNSFYEMFKDNDEFHRQAAIYERSLKEGPPKFFKDTLLMIKSQMVSDMLTRAHTLLDPVEKDVVQRTYYNVNQIIDFLLSPHGWAKKKGRFNLFPNFVSKGNPNPKEGK